ncbi:hypothetical protein L208DRAFT_1334826, partial [Tricholoma matsutake]
ELEMLDTITTLQFYGNLDADMIMADCRNTLISLLRKKKGAEFMPENMHDALHWGPRDPFLEWTYSNLDWHLIKPLLQNRKT